ncbi:MAG TPA: alpha/beta fold hydrolase [Candidatus Hydrogenedentes bacterium]|nr:alpha/beta fold hydrolase [Candidatus Hydrogenedentota bacterium]HPU96879.1 alpha/beta fold hydrolase [Candidatus Hydrogenedentota bacterium]
MRLLVWAVLILLFSLPFLVFFLYTWNKYLAPWLSDRQDRYAKRIPGTSWLLGASPVTLGSSQAKGAVLFIHGFNGAPDHFADLPQKVAEEGWYVRVMVLPGHCTTPRNFLETSPEEMLDAVIEEIQPLYERFGNVVLLGHSMGGSLAVLAAATTSQISGLILAAPYFGLTRRFPWGPSPEWWVQKLSRYIQWIPFPAIFHPIRKKSARKKITAYRWLHAECGIKAMEIARRASDPEVLSKIRIPALLIQSVNDTVTCPLKGQRCFAQLQAPWTESLTVENSDHILFWDYEAPKITQAVLTFLAKLQP